MCKKIRKSHVIALIAVLLAALSVGLLFTAPTVSAGVYVDGNSNRYQTNASNVNGNFKVYETDTNQAIMGYRFTVLQKSDNVYQSKGSIDVYKASWSVNNYDRHLKVTAGGKVYYNPDKYTLKSIYSSITKIEAVAWNENTHRIPAQAASWNSNYSCTSGASINTSKYNYAKAADLGVTLPTSGTENDWVYIGTNVNPILKKINSDYSIDTILPNPEMFVFMEPLFDIRLGNLGDTSNETHAFSITLSEIALIGRLTLGDDSTGYESGGWSAIRQYTNQVTRITAVNQMLTPLSSPECAKLRLLLKTFRMSKK